jgi:DNA-binding transcriptional regulator YiaG
MRTTREEHAILDLANIATLHKLGGDTIASAALCERPHLIRWIRRQTGLTQVQLARELGTTQATISRWEAGVHPPSRRLARAAVRYVLECIEEAGE